MTFDPHSSEGPNPLHPETPPPPRAPRPVFWLGHLFFKPGRFFSYFPQMVTGFSTAYVAMAAGVAGAIDRISTEFMKQELGGRARLPDLLLESWTAYWVFCLGFGVIGAVFAYAIGGWWYRVRLRFAGAGNPDPVLARQVYLFALLILSLPSVLCTLADSVAYDTPLDAERGFGWWWAAFLVFPFWSTYVSYRGVRLLFPVVAGKARIWFLGLPVVVYLFVGGGAAILTAVVPGLFPPDTSRPARIDRPGFHVRYPGNWWIDDADEDYDPDAYFAIQAMQDASILFFLTDSPLEPAERTGEFVESYREQAPGGEVTPFATWGNHHGVGAEFSQTYDGLDYFIRVFTVSTESASATIVEIAEESVRPVVEPGFEQIRNTFRFKE